jgi:hypothetical protein
MNWNNAWNNLWVFLTNAESVAFVLAALGFILAWAWGKNGLKKLTKKQEALTLKLTGWAVLVKLALMAFSLAVNLVFYLKR